VVQIQVRSHFILLCGLELRMKLDIWPISSTYCVWLHQKKQYTKQGMACSLSHGLQGRQLFGNAFGIIGTFIGAIRTEMAAEIYTMD